MERQSRGAVLEDRKTSLCAWAPNERRSVENKADSGGERAFVVGDEMNSWQKERILPRRAFESVYDVSDVRVPPLASFSFHALVTKASLTATT